MKDVMPHPKPRWQAAPVLGLAAVALTGWLPQAGFAVSAHSSPSLQPTSPPQSSTFRLAQTNFNTFFEEGRLQSENRLQRPPDTTIPVSPESQFWQLIVFRQGNVSFWMPPGVLTHETRKLNTASGPINFQTLSSQSGTTRFTAAYTDNLTVIQRQQPTLLLQALRDRLAAQNFKRIGDRAIQLNNQYPGREVTLRSSDETITFRAYVVNQQLYAMGVRYRTATAPTRQVTAFLNSLELLSN
jgi:hypothetical protein